MKRILILALAVAAGVVVGQFHAGALQAQAGGGTSPPPCQDINGDGVSNITDAVYLLQWHFGGGPEPACATPVDRVESLPDTGQSSCYAEVPGGGWAPVPCEQAPCEGQDVSYQTGCSPEGRYVDNGDGTVTDNCTGLMWEKLETVDGAGGIIVRPFPQWLNWCNALAYCEELTLAGHDDWRLPNVRELQSIVDYGRVNPAMDPILGGLTNVYWTSTSGVADPTLGWFVDFSDGRVDCVGPRPDPYSVRAVRSIR